jgi:hypothetical protein
VPDTLVFLLMVALLVGVIGMCVGAALLTIAAWRSLCRVARRAASAVRTAHRREQLVQLLADPAVQWVPCHALGCGHMSTPHHPDRAGVLRCEACGTPAVR